MAIASSPSSTNRERFMREEQNGDGRVRIVLAAEHTLFRQALGSYIEGDAAFSLVAEAEDGVQAVLETERTKPDVVIVDAYMPYCTGLRATSMIKDRVPHCRVIVVGDEDLDTLIQAFQAGASGYLQRTSPLHELTRATLAVHQGDTIVPSGMLGPLLSRLINGRSDQTQAITRLSMLTQREQEVLALITEGCDNEAIASALVISPWTAKTHVHSVLTKLGVHSRLEAAAVARRVGTSPDHARVVR